MRWSYSTTCCLLSLPHLPAKLYSVPHLLGAEDASACPACQVCMSRRVCAACLGCCTGSRGLQQSLSLQASLYKAAWLCQGQTRNSLVLLAAEVIRDYESQEEQESCAQQLAVQDDWSDTVSSTTTGQRGPEDVLALGPTGGKGGNLSRTSSARFRGKRSS